MPKYEIHLAIADKIYFTLGNNIIKNPSLFFSGNLAPDAFSEKRLPDIKKRSHMCEDETVHTYGYGYPEFAELFRNRINKFIENYCLTASDDRDLYIGYAAHLFSDELHRYAVFNHLEKHLKTIGVNTDESGFRKNLADTIYNGEYTYNFIEISNLYSIEIHEYPFNQNLLEVLDTSCGYGIKDYISAMEINEFNRLVYNSVKNNLTQNRISTRGRIEVKEFIDQAADKIIARLSGKDGFIKIL